MGGGGSDKSSRRDNGNKTSSPHVMVVPTGIDLGSLHARVAVCSPQQVKEDRTGHRPKDDKDPSAIGAEVADVGSIQVISNPQGLRYTLALAAREHHHDQNDDSAVDGKKSPNDVVIFGEAARRYLESKKKSLEVARVRDLLLGLSGGAEFSEQEEEEEATYLAQAFFAHVAQSACDASSSGPSELRCVVSIPAAAAAAARGTKTNEEGGFENEVSKWREYVDGLTSCVGGGIKSLISTSTGGGGGNKKGQKQRGKKGKDSKGSDAGSSSATAVVIGTISDPAAVCVANGLTETSSLSSTTAAGADAITLKLCGTAGNDDFGTISESVVTTERSKRSSKQGWKTCVVVDWGASGISATLLERLPAPSFSSGENTDTSAILRIVRTAHDSTCSGREVVQVLCRHVASIFERKTGIIGVLENRKALSKLQHACESAIRTLSRTGMAQISVDGLYEGADLHLPVSRPRFEMLLGPLLQKARKVIGAVVSRGEKEDVDVDVALKSGDVCEMPSAAALIKSMFPHAWEGDSTVPPGEAVAIGCAKQASTITANHGTVKAVAATETKTKSPRAQEDVDLSPISIGLAYLVDGKNVDNAEIVTLIPRGCPLPVRVARRVVLEEEDGDDNKRGATAVLAIVEICCNEEEEKTSTSAAIVGKMIIPAKQTEMELSMDLETSGKLLVAVNGGRVVTI